MTRSRLAKSVYALFWMSLVLMGETLAHGERQMVITIDDLPYQASGYPDTLVEANRVTDRLLEALDKYQVPTTGFVNESNLQVGGEADARAGLLERWAEAGATLGNHTYSHADLNSLSIEAYKREIVNGETVTLVLMASRPNSQLFFRHPYTHTGDTEYKKTKIAEFLEERGYQIAPYTIDSQDSIFNRVYRDARHARNEELAGQVRLAYIEFVVATTDFAEGISVKLFGSQIPQTIVFHANSINADILEEVLERLDERGYTFIDLADVMEHPVYRTEDKLVTSYGPSWLWRWNMSLELDINFRGDPEPPSWVRELYEESIAADQ